MKLSIKFLANIFTAIFLLSLMPQNLLLNFNENILKAVCVLTVDIVAICMAMYFSGKLFQLTFMLKK